MTLVTSGVNIGSDGMYDGNDDEIARVYGVRPDAFGQVFVDLTLREGSYAYLNAMEMTVSEARWGDADYDGDVDVDDLDAFIGCCTGPGLASDDADCRLTFDVDGDGRLDLRDFAAFQAAFDGL